MPDANPHDITREIPAPGIVPTHASDATTDFSIRDEDRVRPGSHVVKHQGETLGNYDILAELGRGGMGVVYKAFDRKLGRLVALKVILSGGHASSTERQRFQFEVEAAARLQHPNIAQVYEVGENNGQPYMAMEYCAGGTLDAQLRDQPQPAREVAQMVATLADALHHAHEAGIVHRDIKPANVLLGADGSPKVVDFGLAKRLDGSGGVTQTGAIMGSLGYMAPEQAAGRTRDANPATDVYSLGAVIYKMLTGRPPFHGLTDLETINSIVARDPVSIRSLQPRVPMDLVTICHKCLEKNPARRYATAAELAADLRRYLAHLPIKARPLGPLERSWRWVRRHPGLSLLIGAGLTTLILVAGCLGWSAYRSYCLINDVHTVLKPLQDLSGEIRYLDEVQTSSALLAATTGDPAWEARYHEHDAELSRVLKQAARLSPVAADTLADVDAANDELAAMERQAFDLVRQGRSAEALRLLQGTHFKEVKSRYGKLLDTFNDRIDAHEDAIIANAQKETEIFVILAASATIVVLLLFGAGGVLALRSLRKG